MMAGRIHGPPRSELEQITGIGARYAGILEAAGVASVGELAEQNPLELADALLEVNLLREIVLVVPSETRVAGWIERARAQNL